jgi:hypothetical protein
MKAESLIWGSAFLVTFAFATKHYDHGQRYMFSLIADE